MCLSSKVDRNFRFAYAVYSGWYGGLHFHWGLCLAETGGLPVSVGAAKTCLEKKREKGRI